jgi:methyl-accepting chemotaxis protein
VEQVSALVAEIAAATQEQGNGIEQVNTAVTQMDEVVQQNASLVEEAAAATASMQGEAELLLQRVSRFRLPEDAVLAAQEGATAPPSAASRPGVGLSGHVRPALAG